MKGLPCEPQARAQRRGGPGTSTSLHVPFGQRQTLWGRPRGPPASFVRGGMVGAWEQHSHTFGLSQGLQNLVPQGCSLPESCPPSRSVPGSWSPGGLLGVCPTGTVALSPQRCLGAPARGESPPGGVRGAPAPAGCARVQPPRSGTAVHGGICCTRRGRWAASELSVCGGGCHRNPFPPERGGGRGRRLLVGRASGE